MPGKKLTALTQATTLNNTDLIYVVKPDETAGSRSQGIEKSDFETSFSPGGSTTNRVVQGGIVWTGTGLVYESLNLIYEINGQQFAIADGTQVTLATADGTHPRLDNLYGDDTGAIGKVTGTPAATPVLTSVDETSQISITFALVAVSATTPSDVDIRDVYLENAQEVGGEWDTAESTSGVRIDLANTTSPLTSTKDIKTLSALTNADTITFDHTTATTIVNFSYLQFSIKLLTAWANDHLIIQLKNGATVISTCVVDGSKLDITDITNIQTISLFKAEFTAASDTEFDTITVYNRVKGASTLQYQMDDITVYEDAGGTDPVQILASDVSVDTTNFSGNLTSADDTVQKALETLDDLTALSGSITSKTGTSIVFTEDALYNEATYLTSGNLTLSLTSAVKGTYVAVFCDGYIPTISGEDYFISAGSLDANSLNILSFFYDGTKIYLNIGNVVQLSAPTLTLTPGDTQMQVDWVAIANADNYVIEQADDSGFTTNLTEIYNGALLTTTKTSLTNGQTYYYRGKSDGNGFTTSDWSATVSGTPAVASTDFTVNLIASYALQTDGTDYNATHTMTLSNSPTHAAAKVGNGVTLNGTSQDGSITDHNDFSFTDGAGTDQVFSISCWMYFDDFTGIEDIIGKFNVSGSAEWLINKNGSNLQFTLYSGGSTSNYINTVYDMTALSTATWYHFVFTYDASEANTGLNIYKDGSLATTSDGSGGTYTGMSNGSQNVKIGSRVGAANWFAGRLDELHFWSVERSSGEATEIYDLENAGTSILP